VYEYVDLLLAAFVCLLMLSEKKAQLSKGPGLPIASSDRLAKPTPQKQCLAMAKIYCVPRHETFPETKEWFENFDRLRKSPFLRNVEQAFVNIFPFLKSNTVCFKKSFTVVFQVLQCGECYETFYT
jgi:hypothetical protein